MSNRSRIAVLVLGLAALLAGCAHSIHQYSVGDFDTAADFSHARQISADSEQFVVLSLAFNTDYADEAYQKLLANCPRGNVSGISARHSTSLGFLSYTNKLHLQALCSGE